MKTNHPLINAEAAEQSEWLHNRRQFVLGPRPVDRFRGWNSERIADRLYLTTHPELKKSRVVDGNKSLTLLGFILDSRHPQHNDCTILAKLMPQLCSDAEPEEFLQHLDVFGGRWALIVDNGERITICNDALAQRQVYYTPALANGEVWCGSQPGTIASFLDLEPSRAAIEFVKAQKKNCQPEYWLPNDTSAYDQIKLLLPNHYLDLSTAQTQRFWPNVCQEKLSLRAAVKPAAKMLKNLMVSAASRFPLAVLMSAGWDSRIVLAATRDVKTEVSYFTWDHGIEETPDADLDVPERLLAKLGRTRRMLHVPERMDPDFRQHYLQNVSMAHECWGALGEALLRSLEPSELRVAGDGSETVRQQYRPWTTNITPETLAEFAKTNEEFAIEAFGKWLAKAPKNLGFDILDLFYWEQRAGQWLAMGQAEWDIIGETFTPFNCRALLATLLSTDVAYRVAPRYELYRSLLLELWPQVLCEPVNPHKRFPSGSELRARVKDLLVRSHLIEHARRFSNTVA